MEKLRLLREARHMSQKQLALLVHKRQQTIGKYENGQSEPSIETLIALARYFRVSVDYLIDNSDDPREVPFLIEFRPTDREIQMIERLRLLSPELKRQLLSLSRELEDDHLRKQSSGTQK